MITTFNATDLDSSAIIRYSLDPNRCEAKNERGILLRVVDFNCSQYFHLDQFDGSLRIAKVIDRELTDAITLGVRAEDVASDTGAQIDTGRLIKITSKRSLRKILFPYSQPYYRY